MAEVCDVAIVIALKEEYQALERGLFRHGARRLERHEQILTSYYYSFIVPGSRGETRWIVTYGESERDKSGTRVAAERLFQRWAPRLLVSLGISGGVDKDVALGDVVVASQVEDYLYRSKLEGDGDDPGVSLDDLAPGGRSFEVHQPTVKAFEQLETVDPSSYRRWQDAAHSRVSENGAAVVDQLTRTGVFRKTVRVHSGPVASAPWVVSHPKLKDLLKKRVGRNLLAVDTESAGVVAAARDRTDQRPVIVVRAISDSAERKSDVDQIGDGVVRDWALQNAVDAVMLFLRSDLYPPDRTGERTVPAVSSRNWPEVLHDHTAKTWCRGVDLTAPSAAIADFFRMVATPALPAAIETFEHVADRIEGADGRLVLLVEGAPGTGKSKFLRGLYARLRDRRRAREDAPIPVLIHAKAYERVARETVAGSEGTVPVATAFRRDLELLRNAMREDRAARFVMMVDGLDAHRPFVPALQAEIRSLREEAEGRLKYVAAIRRDETAKTSTFSERALLLLTLSSVPTDGAALKGVAGAFVRAVEGPPHKELGAALVAQIVRYQLDRVDARLLNLLTEKHAVRSYEGAESISEFLVGYCRERLEHHGGALDRLAEMAFSCFVQPGRPPSPAEMMGEQESWRLLHWHPLLRDVLIARHVVRLLQEYSQEGGVISPRGAESLANLYPSGVMRRIKEIINVSKPAQWSIVAALKKAHTDGPARMLAVVCYLAGRLRERPTAKEVRPLLRQIVARFRPQAENDRESLLVLRSAYISLILLNDEEAETEYIHGLLRNKVWDNLNRGFHLEYYGDVPTDPGSPMCAEDDLKATCSRTFEQLMARVQKGLDQRGPLFQLETYTLCSLARHRHARGPVESTLREDERIRLCALISSLLDKGNLLIAEVGEYVAAARVDLEIDRFRVGALAEVLFRLKEYKRSGWVERGIVESESIAGHVFGAYLLGLFFLPKSGPPGYDKQKILNAVLIHDLAESVTGDVPSPRKNAHHVVDERRWMSYLALSSTYAEVDEDVAALRGTFEDFSGTADNNSRIARDLDKIDNLVQLLIYQSRGFEIRDFDQWRLSLVTQIGTRQGKQVRDTILSHFEQGASADKLGRLTSRHRLPAPVPAPESIGQALDIERRHRISALYRRYAVGERVQWKARIREAIAEAGKFLLVSARTLDDILPPKRKQDGLADVIQSMIESGGKVVVMLANTFDKDSGFRSECQRRDPANPRSLYRPTRDTVMQFLQMADDLDAYDRLTLRLSKPSPAFAMFMTERRAIVEPYLPYREGGEGIVFEVSREGSRALGDAPALPGTEVYDAYYLSFRRLIEAAEHVHPVVSRYYAARGPGAEGAYREFIPLAERMARFSLDWSKLEDLDVRFAPS